MRFSSTTLLLFLLGGGETQACSYLGRRTEADNTPASIVNHHHHQRLLQGGRFQGTATEAIVQASEDILDLIDDDDDRGATFVRLGFHDCVGGICDGCVDLTNPDNDGLQGVINLLSPIASFYQDQLTRADIWALAALTAADEARGNNGPAFVMDYYGRATCNDATGGPDRPMPGNHLTTNELLTFFDENFGFTTRETVAIMGGHTLLRNGNSGFNGRWVRNDENLNNNFYDLLIDNGSQATDNYVSTNNGQNNEQFLSPTLQWRRNNGGGGGGGGGGNGGGGGLVMLNSDMALIADLTGQVNTRTGAVTCSIPDTCPPATETLPEVIRYSNSNGAWLTDFHGAFSKLLISGSNTAGCSTFPCFVGEGIAPSASPPPPTVSPPTVPAPTVPVPTVPAPTVPAPTVPAPTVPAPTVPAPTVPAPTVPPPTAATITAPSVQPGDSVMTKIRDELAQVTDSFLSFLKGL